LEACKTALFPQLAENTLEIRNYPLDNRLSLVAICRILLVTFVV